MRIDNFVETEETKQGCGGGDSKMYCLLWFEGRWPQYVTIMVRLT